VQIALLDVLINAGASTDGETDDALVNGNFDAARHLSQKGAKLTLSTALCLERWHETDQLALSATSDLRQFSLVLAALNGKVEAVRKAIAYGADVNKPSNYLYSHATALHHSVGSGNSETVKVLVRVGADLNARDAAYGASPLGWAVYGRHKEIEDYLRKGGAQE
jgi:peptide-methionine (S)-S-oxide reductase